MNRFYRGKRFLGWIVAICVISSMLEAQSRADLWGLSVDPINTAEPGTENNYNKVYRFDNEGNKLPNDIPTSAGLVFPSGIAVSPSGTIYVSSVATGRIYHFDGETGDPLPSTQLGGPAGLFAFLGDAAPAQLAFGPDGNLYVSEFFGTTVRVYNPADGTRLADAATGLTSAGGLAFTAGGDLLVGDGFVMAEGQTARIVRVEPGSPGVLNPFGISGGGMLSSPTSLLVLPNNDVLAVDVLGNYIARFDETGMNFQPFAVMPPAIPDPLPPGVQVPTNSPSDIKFDPDGNLIVSLLGLTYPPDDRGALLRYDLSGNLLETIVDGLEPIAGIDWTVDSDTLAGDYNQDESVSGSDYSKWTGDFGAFVARGNGADGNGDGVVDAADYVVWRKLQSAGAGGESSVGGVPEPASIAILIYGIFCWAASGRSHLSRSSRG